MSFKILSFLKNNKNTLKYVIGFILIWFIFVQPIKNELKRERSIRKKFEENVIFNLNSLKDSVERKIDNNGNLYSEKLSLTLESIDQLQLYDEQLYKKISEDNRNLKYFINSKVSIDLKNDGKIKSNLIKKSDSVFYFENTYNYLDSGITHNFKIGTPFKLNFNNKSLNFNKDSVSILENNFLINLKYSLIQNNDGSQSVIARSPSELVFFNDLNSISINKELYNSKPEYSKWGVGTTIGLGYTPNGFYPFIGIGLNYNLIRIKKFK